MSDICREQFPNADSEHDDCSECDHAEYLHEVQGCVGCIDWLERRDAPKPWVEANMAIVMLKEGWRILPTELKVLCVVAMATALFGLGFTAAAIAQLAQC